MQERLSHLIPDVFNVTREADEYAGLFSNASKNEYNRVVRAISDNMRKEGYTLKREITLVAILAVQKFPGLKGAYVQPHVSILILEIY